MRTHHGIVRAAPAAALFFGLTAASPALARQAEARVDNLAVIIDEERNRAYQPAIAASVFRGNGLIGLGVRGHRAEGQAEQATNDDLFHIGSITKSMTAMLAAMLVEQGSLSWNTTLAEAMPDFAPQMNELYRPVTIEQMLTHRAGMPPFTSGGAPEFAMTRDLSGTPMEQRAQFARRVLAKHPVTPPGSGYAYSNADVSIVAAVVEQKSGKSWEELMRTRIFEPLGMSSAGFGWPATPDRPNQPRGHIPGPNGFAPSGLDDPYRLPLVLAPAGDVHCSVADLARYGGFHLRALRGEASDPAILKPETVKYMHSCQKNYAMGWIPAGTPYGEATWHNGSAGTFFAQILLVPPADIGVVAVSNAGTGATSCNNVCLTLLKKYAKAPDKPQVP